MSVKARMETINTALKFCGYEVKHKKISARSKWVYAIYKQGGTSPFSTCEDITTLEAFGLGFVKGHCLGVQDTLREAMREVSNENKEQ